MSTGFEQAQLSLAHSGADGSAQTAATRLSQEASESFLGGLESGFVDRVKAASHDILGTSLEVGSGLALGAGLSLLSRNPEWLAGYAGKVAEYAPKALGVLAAGDLTWRALSAHNGTELGRNFGAALFDYPLMGLSGALGSGATSMVLAGRPSPIIAPTDASAPDLTVGRTASANNGIAAEGTVEVPRTVPKATEEPIAYNRRGYIDEGDEGHIYNNGNGTITKVFDDPNTDVEKIVGMFEQLRSIGVRLPEIMTYGKTTDGKPAIVMQMIGDGRHLRNQLILGQIPAAEKPSLIAQYDAMARALQKHGFRIDWQLKNMIWDQGKLYIVDPSFLQLRPLDQVTVDYMRPSL